MLLLRVSCLVLNFSLFLTSLTSNARTTSFERTKKAVQRVFSDIELFVFIEGVIDVAKEQKRMESDLASAKKRLEGIRRRLENKSFVDKAPEDVVEGERARMKELETLAEDLKQSLESLRA